MAALSLLGGPDEQRAQELQLGVLVVVPDRGEAGLDDLARVGGRSAQEAGLTRYHLRELLKRHGLKGGDVE